VNIPNLITRIFISDIFSVYQVNQLFFFAYVNLDTRLVEEPVDTASAESISAFL
jgi:hypothetical protein